MIIDQLIDRINWIHAKGIIYNDITPENFLVGLGDKVDKIFVVDFGSCQKYLDGEGNHMKPEKEKIEFKTDGRFRSAHRHIAKRMLVCR